MAINVVFNGATIYKPGAYSKSTIDLGGGFPIGPAGLIAVLGEADAGRPGNEETNLADNRFTADQLISIRDKYRSGAIVDAASFLFSPAADAAIPGGAQTVWIYKTNASDRAELPMLSDSAAYATLQASEYGVGGNRITYTCLLVDEVAPSVASTATFDDATATLANEEIDIYLDGVLEATWDLGVGTSISAPPVVAGLTIDITDAGTAAASVSITVDADAAANARGHGRSLELRGTGCAIVNLNEGIAVSSVESSGSIVVDQKRDGLIESTLVGGDVVLTVGRDSSGGVVAAEIVIDEANISLREDTGSGMTDAVVLDKSSFATIKQIADEISLRSGWSAAVPSTLFNQCVPDCLDRVTVGCLSESEKPARIKKDAYDVRKFFEDGSLCRLASISSYKGLPDASTETVLTGGAKGGTSPAAIIDALDKFTKFHVNSVVPLFSRDATADIADGLTDPSSTYTIDGIHQAVKTHLSLMKTTKKRSERQGYLSLKDSYLTCKEKAGDMADGRIQMVIQDIRQIDAQGNIKWFQPWALSCLMAGARGGAPIGEPLTFKFMNASGIRQTAQPMTTDEADITVDFDPDLQGDDAIQSGITFLESPQSGGFRIVVDNTTYGIDNNFVFNRANVIYAADTVAFNFRNTLENIYVGRKNTVSATDIQSTAASILTGFLQQGITVATDDAPQGYKNLTVELVGNVIRVNCTIKIVEGIDFILSEINIERATSSAG